MSTNEKRINDLLSMSDKIGFSDIALKVAKEGGSVSDFLSEVSVRSRETPVHESADKILGFDSGRDAGGYSLSRALCALHNDRWDKAGLEKGVSNLSQGLSDRVPNGIFVPLSLLSRDLNVGTAAEAGNLVNASRGNSIVDPIRNASAALSLGATVLQGCKDGLQIPRFDVDAQGSALEIGAAGSATASSSLIDLTAKRYPIKLIVSIQAMKQSSTALDVFFQKALTAAIYDSLDNEAINGAGTGSASLGVRATPNVGNVAVGTDGGFPTWALLCDVEDKPAAANRGETELSGWILNSKTRRYLRTLPKGTNLDYIWQGGERPLLGHRARVSNIMPSNLVKGASGAVCSSMVFSTDWSDMIIACYGGGVDVTIDRITQASIGKVVINASLYAAVGLMRPQSFSKIDDIKTA